jgi:hypothetical protein
MLDRLLDALRVNRAAAIAGAVISVLGLTASVLVGLQPLIMLGLLVAWGFTTWGIYRRRTRSLDPRPATAPSGMLASSGLLAVAIVFLIAQAVPYGRSHSNPPVTGEPAWDTPQTRDLMARACFDCHSNETVWPWYSNIAPISWALTMHVDEGRRKVNYQEWDRPQREADNTLEVVKEGSMPPAYFTFGGLHSDANLSDAELSALVRGLGATPGLSD